MSNYCPTEQVVIGIIHSMKQECSPIHANNVAILEKYIAALTEENKRLRHALEYAKEVIDDQANRFHQNCRCQLCEGDPMVIESALRGDGKE